ncbi:hypothetical protein L1987_64476 [Smallanthus sonchifolius]|uniref:Uncharacterized protein n=1 Tax=Smallanthus sonchifolius TaxID=185202 RepID=A0ACB9CG82_9ASTR|nr:hypothetical protein L1987_64476 [Smallanthus sonchifolius]
MPSRLGFQFQINRGGVSCSVRSHIFRRDGASLVRKISVFGTVEKVRKVKMSSSNSQSGVQETPAKRRKVCTSYGTKTQATSTSGRGTKHAFPNFLHFLGLQKGDDGATTTASSVVAPSSYASLYLHTQNKILGFIYTQAGANLGKKTTDSDAEFGLIKKLLWLLRNWYEIDTVLVS